MNLGDISTFVGITFFRFLALREIFGAKRQMKRLRLFVEDTGWFSKKQSGGMIKMRIFRTFPTHTAEE